MFDYDAMTSLITRVVKVIRSCESVDHCAAAGKYMKLAERRYYKLTGHKQIAGQFALDMVTLLHDVFDDVKGERIHSAPWNPFINDKYNPFLYPKTSGVRNVSQVREDPKTSSAWVSTWKQGSADLCPDKTTSGG